MNKVIKWENQLTFWCPGCKSTHSIDTTKWTWNGSLKSPTISPSILRRTGPFPDGHIDICHSFVRDGKIEFCGDCTHGLSGIYEMPPLDNVLEDISISENHGLCYRRKESEER